MPTSPVEVVGALVLLFLVMLPLGTLLIRCGERFLGRTVRLSIPERALLAFYASGGLLFVIASIPVPIFGLPLIGTLLAAGAVGYLWIGIKEQWAGLNPVLRFMTTPTGLLLAGGTLGLLILEVVPTSAIPFPNTYDGSVTALWMNLTLANHTLPWTLQPYASWGVVYPLGTTVWMTIPVILFGWTIVSIPLFLLPLFLAFSIPSAYCWGSRLGGFPSRGGDALGLLFALFFGLVVSWPRFLVGGSYDFAFVLPLLLLVIGWIRPFIAGEPAPWRDVVCFGLVIGVMSTLSLGASEPVLLLILGSLVAFGSFSLRHLGAWLLRLGAIVGLSVGFLIRSFIGFALWFSYPGHVLTQAGNPPYAAFASPYAFSASVLLGNELDPFIEWKRKLSPFPVLALELQILLVLGLVLLVFCVFKRLEGHVPWGLPRDLAATIALQTAVALLWTGFLVFAAVPGSPLSAVMAVSSLAEASVILFIFLQVIAVLPLAWAGSLLSEKLPGFAPALERPVMPRSYGLALEENPTYRTPRSLRRGVCIAVALVLLVPIGTGAFVTVTQVPGLLQDATLSTTNVTASDVQAMKWVGNNLPSCSRVLVAPGSAAQFLPEYAHVRVVFPMNPQPANLSYTIIVSDLTQGLYGNASRDIMIELDVNEVFVTGPSTSEFPPFQLTPLLNSPDFRELYQAGDAAVLAFGTAIPGAGCGF